MYLADLHVHTRISDGSCTAEELLKLAAPKGITHISFTDHDTAKCAKEHKALAQSYGIRAVEGVELSAYDPDTGKKVHILGYGYQSSDNINGLGWETLRKRDRNCRRQIEILDSLGYRIDAKEVAKLSGDTIYKQHILDVLKKSGRINELFGDVYANIFKGGGPCDFDIDYPDAREAVRAVKADGGMAVLAHPGQQDNYMLIPDLLTEGLDGIEYNHPSHDARMRQRAKLAAEEFGLFMTGGSDFHGSYEKLHTELLCCPAPDESRCLFTGHDKI